MTEQTNLSTLRALGVQAQFFKILTTFRFKHSGGGDIISLHPSVLCEDLSLASIFEKQFKKGLRKCGILQVIPNCPKFFENLLKSNFL